MLVISTSIKVKPKVVRFRHHEYCDLVQVMDLLLAWLLQAVGLATVTSIVKVLPPVAIDHQEGQQMAGISKSVCYV